jgi:phage-related protein
VWSFTKNLFKNIGKNIVSVVKNIPALISGDKSITEMWTPLTKGFENSIKEMPKIAERQRGELEKSLASDVGRLGDQLGTAIGENVLRRQAEVTSAMKSIGDVATELTKGGGEVAKIGKQIGQGFGQKAGQEASKIGDKIGKSAQDRELLRADSAKAQAFSNSRRNLRQLQDKQQVKEQRNTTQAVNRTAQEVRGLRNQLTQPATVSI